MEPKAFLSRIKQYLFLIILALTAFGLALILHRPLRHFPDYVDWDTIVTLTGLLLITTGVKESGFFYLLAYRISRKINNVRLLSLFLVFSAALLSMFFTNDIALFIIVPLTLCLQDISKNNYTKLIIFEAVAVNAGSTLTPIGNPQNIFLWHQWGPSFPMFVKEMAPLVLILLTILFIFTRLSFPSKTIMINHLDPPAVKRKMFFLSLILLVLFIVSIEMDAGGYFLPLIFLFFLILYRKIIYNVDWTLIFLFIFIFIDMHLLGEIKQIQMFFNGLNLNDPGTLFLSAGFLSQFISNVPAAVLLSQYSSNFKIIAYGVNVGGNGLLIASFANIIAMNFIKDKAKHLSFHLYSIAFFIITLIAVLIILV